MTSFYMNDCFWSEIDEECIEAAFAAAELEFLNEDKNKRKGEEEQMEVMRSHEERIIKQVREVTSENKKYSVQVKQAQDKISELSRRLTSYEKDKELLTHTRKKLSAALKDHENMRWENEVLELRFSKCRTERDELHSRFVSAILELQQKTGLRNVLLEKKIEKLTDMLEQREAQVNEIMAAAQLDPEAVVNVNEKVEEILNRKDTAIQDLQHELAKACKAHDDILATYGAKLQEYGIPETELGFQPLRSRMVTCKIGIGPAGLVSANP